MDFTPDWDIPSGVFFSGSRIQSFIARSQGYNVSEQTLESEDRLMPTAEIIAIGTELLLGEVVDTNTSFIARTLREVGVDLYRTSIIGDNPERISNLIQEASKRADLILTTGGLGPTVDDPTRRAVASALKTDLVFHPELWEMIKERFRNYGSRPTKNNRQQAFLPEGAEPIRNYHGTAPGLKIPTDRGFIFALPGVPAEMERMLQDQVIPFIMEKFSSSGVIVVRNIQTRGIGESRVDDLIGDLELLENPTVGLAAGKGAVKIRLTAKAKDEIKAETMLNELELDIKNRLSRWIVDENSI